MCDAAADFERTRDEANALRREHPGDVASINDGVINSFERLAKSVPSHLQPDVQLILANLRATFAGTRPTSGIDESVAAAKRLNEYVDVSCGP